MEREAAAAEASESALAEAVAASKEAAVKEICDVSTLAAELRDRAEMSEKEAQEHRLQRAAMLVSMKIVSCYIKHSIPVYRTYRHNVHDFFFSLALKRRPGQKLFPC